MKGPKPVELDGRTGEGGGQLLRVAVCLAAVAKQPIRITNIRGNREGPRGGGLKAQHLACVEWLAKASNATVSGLHVGSKTLDFVPTTPPSQFRERSIKITAGTAAASALLIFQAVLPFLLFAGGDRGDEPIELEIEGGTNVTWSPSFEYVDQVLLPCLEYIFGVHVSRELRRRGWISGAHGSAYFRISPLRLGDALRCRFRPGGDTAVVPLGSVASVDVSIVAPGGMHSHLQEALARDVETLFPGTEMRFVLVEESGADARIYVLLVGRPAGEENCAWRWGADLLFQGRRKGKSARELSEGVARKVARSLFEQVARGGLMDEYLEDQLVIFQALAEGMSSFAVDDPSQMGDGEDTQRDERREPPGDEQVVDGMRSLKLDENSAEKRLRKDKMHQPFGDGSTHTTTARWVTAEMLPKVCWYNKGMVCNGVGMQMDKPS